MAAFLDLAMARLSWNKDQAALAAKVKLIGQRALAEMMRLNLVSLRYLTTGVEELVAVATAFLLDRNERSSVMVFKRFGIPPDTPRATKPLGCPPYVSALTAIVTSEASTLFHQSDGWKKFEVYKCLDVAAENLWSLGSLIGWDEAAFMGTALQCSLTTQAPFTVTVPVDVEKHVGSTGTPDDDDDDEWDMGSSVSE